MHILNIPDFILQLYVSMPFLPNISLTEGKMVVGNKRNGKVNEYKCIVSHTLHWNLVKN